MAVPVWSVGQVLTASDVNTWFVPDAVIKPSAQHVNNNSTTFINDTALVLPLAANATYVTVTFVFYSGAGPATGDIKVTFTWPSGTTSVLQVISVNTGGVTLEGGGYTASSGFPAACSGNGGGVFRSCQVVGSVTTAATTGNLQFLWCQNTANAGTDTIVYAGSYMTLYRIG